MEDTATESTVWPHAYWSHDEINLLKEFLHVSRAGGCFEGPIEDATWEHIAMNMNCEAAARGMKIRVYTAKDAAWHYLSQILPLYQPLIANTPHTGGPWTLDEDDLLLHYLSETRVGGHFTGSPEEGTYQKVADNMNRIAHLFGFHARVYTAEQVRARYQVVIFPRLTGRDFWQSITAAGG